jgi:hypothetical protein
LSPDYRSTGSTKCDHIIDVALVACNLIQEVVAGDGIVNIGNIDGVVPAVWVVRGATLPNLIAIRDCKE